MYPCESTVKMTELSQGPGENFTCHEDSSSRSDQNHQKKRHTYITFGFKLWPRKRQSSSYFVFSEDRKWGEGETPNFPLVCSCTDLSIIEMKFPVKKTSKYFEVDPSFQLYKLWMVENTALGRKSLFWWHTVQRLKAQTYWSLRMVLSTMLADLLEDDYFCNRPSKSLPKHRKGSAVHRENACKPNGKAVLWKMQVSSLSPCFPPAAISS